MRLLTLCTAVTAILSLPVMASFPEPWHKHPTNRLYTAQPAPNYACADQYGQLATREDIMSMVVQTFCYGLAQAIKQQTVQEHPWYGLADGWSVSKPDSSTTCYIRQASATVNICKAVDTPPSDQAFSFTQPHYKGDSPFLGRPDVGRAGQSFPNSHIRSLKLGRNVYITAWAETYFKGAWFDSATDVPETQFLVRSIRLFAK